MRDDTNVLGKLVTAMDDARLFCIDASALATRPWLQRTWDRLARTHQVIAGELLACVTANGNAVNGVPANRRPRAWRTTWAGWLARNHFDSDLAYLEQADRQEARLGRRFARAVRQTPDGSTHWRLLRYSHEVDHARTNITRVIALVEQDIDARLVQKYSVARLASLDDPAPPPRIDLGA